MKSFFNNLSNRFPFFANRPSALERAVRQSPKSRRLRMEPLENRALLAVDAFGGAASLVDSDVGASWGPDPEPAAFSASILATDAAIIDVSDVNATIAETSFSVQSEVPEPVAPPSFDQLMESLGMIEIESLDDESDVASLSYLDATDATQTSETQAEARQVVFYDSSAADFDASTLNLDDESVYYVDAANAGDAESNSATPRSGGGSGDSGGFGGSSNSGGSTNSGGMTVNDPSDCYLTTYGSSTISESATFTGSGGSDQGPYFGFTTSAIPSGYSAYVRFSSSDVIFDDAVYGLDYTIMSATIDKNSVVTPNTNYVSGGQNPDGTYDLYVYGPATYCVVPLSDALNESYEGLQATFYLVDMMSGGADYDPTPINCGSFNATIVDDGVEYYYETVITATTPTREDPPAEDPDFVIEATTYDFVAYYYRENASPDDNMSLDETSLEDDYRRAIYTGENLTNWIAMEQNAQAAVLAHLRNGGNLTTLPTYQENVSRNVTNEEGLFVFGDGFTNVSAVSTATLVDVNETTDDLGLVESVKTYRIDVNYVCEVNDMFVDPLDIEERFNWTFNAFGTPYHLTGSWNDVYGSYNVTVATTRIEVDA